LTQFFSAFFDNYWKNSPTKSASDPKFFGTGHDKLGIPERKARLIWGVCVGFCGRRPPNAAQNREFFCAVFAVAAGPFVVCGKEYFRTSSLALVVP